MVAADVGEELMNEQRKAIRHELNLKIAEVFNRPGAIARILDISTTGAKVEANFEIAVDEILEFNLNSWLPVLTGKVIWVTAISDDPLSCLVGISFNEPFIACHDLIVLNSEYHHLIQEQKERIAELEEHLTWRRSWWKKFWRNK
jgi:hypothetical protein